MRKNNLFKKVICSVFAVLLTAQVTKADCTEIYQQKIEKLKPNKALLPAGPLAVFYALSPVTWGAIIVGLNERSNILNHEQELIAMLSLVNEAKTQMGPAHKSTVELLAARGITISEDQLRSIVLKADSENYLCPSVKYDQMKYSTFIDKIVAGNLFAFAPPKRGLFLYINHFKGTKKALNLWHRDHSPAMYFTTEHDNDLFAQEEKLKYHNVQFKNNYNLNWNFQDFKGKTVGDAIIDLTDTDKQVVCIAFCAKDNDLNQTRLIYSTGVNSAEAFADLDKCEQPGENRYTYMRGDGTNRYNFVATEKTSCKKYPEPQR